MEKDNTKLPENTFTAIYEVARRKYDYLDRMEAWERRTGLLKRFSRPRDPFPQVQEYQLVGLLDSALQGSFPELCGYRADDRRPDQFRLNPYVWLRRNGAFEMNFDVHMKDSCRFHREQYEYRKGYGFVDTGYSVNGTLESVSRNRNTVYTRKLDGRQECGDVMEPVFRRLDYFRSAVVGNLDRGESFPERDLKSYLDMTLSFRARQQEQMDRDSMQTTRVPEQDSLDGYIKARWEMERTAYRVSRRMEENTQAVRDLFNAREKRCREYAERLSPMGTLVLGDDIARRRRDAVLREFDCMQALEAVQGSHAQTGPQADGKILRENVFRDFAALGRESGLTLEEITDFLKTRCEEFGRDDMPVVTDALRRVDSEAVGLLDSTVRRSYYENDRSLLQEAFSPTERSRKATQGNTAIRQEKPRRIAAAPCPKLPKGGVKL